MKLLHFFRPRSCLKYLRINGDADVVCCKCGRVFGFTYCVDPVRVFVFDRYIRFRPEISRFVRHAQKPVGVEERASINWDAIISTLGYNMVSADPDPGLSEDPVEDRILQKAMEDFNQ